MDEDTEAPLHFGTIFFITVTTTINTELCEITLKILRWASGFQCFENNEISTLTWVMVRN